MEFQGTSADLCWLAGLLEGEGYFALIKGKYAKIELEMTDRDVVERAWRITGVGTFRESTSPRDVRKNNKRRYRWSVQRKEHVLPLMSALQPFMGARKANKIQGILKLNDVEGTVLA